MSFLGSSARAQDLTPPTAAQVEGIVRDPAGKAAAGVSVHLQETGSAKSADAQTDTDGRFVFLAVRAGTYTLKLEKPGFHDAVLDSIKLSPAEKKHCDFVLARLTASAPPTSDSSSSPSAIALDDRPNFTVAGVTDSTGSGGHGSETRMRTGEALAKETLSLGSESQDVAATGEETVEAKTQTSESALRTAVRRNSLDFEANHKLGEFYLRAEKCRAAIPLLETADRVSPADHQNGLDLAFAYAACGELRRARARVDRMLAKEKDLDKPGQAALFRLVGELDEKAGDPLEAEQEYERAAGLDPSERNYFAWGTELLLHRAAAPAIEVFSRGARLHPDSARMLAGLGAALYTSGSAEEAAQRLCQASDLEPASPAPYLFLGKMQEAASASLPCAEEKLARFAQDQPATAAADYYYAVALWKRDRGSATSETLEHAKALLEKSSALDPKFDLASLQLGNLFLAQGDLQEALAAYQQAVVINPDRSDSHYGLGLTYKRMGEDAKAQVEFEEYKRLDKTEAAAIERQRRELRQFLFVLRDQTAVPGSTPVSK